MKKSLVLKFKMHMHIHTHIYTYNHLSKSKGNFGHIWEGLNVLNHSAGDPQAPQERKQQPIARAGF